MVSGSLLCRDITRTRRPPQRRPCPARGRCSSASSISFFFFFFYFSYSFSIFSLGRLLLSPLTPSISYRCRSICFLIFFLYHTPLSPYLPPLSTYLLLSHLSYFLSHLLLLPLHSPSTSGFYFFFLLFHLLRYILLAVLEHPVDQTRLLFLFALTAPRPPILLHIHHYNKPNIFIFLPIYFSHFRISIFTPFFPFLFPLLFFFFFLSSFFLHILILLSYFFSFFYLRFPSQFHP